MSEWIECRLPYWTIDSYTDTFDKRGLFKPGMQIRLRDGRELIIGDINKNNGGCGCCGGIDYDDTIVAYRNLLEDDNGNPS